MNASLQMKTDTGEDGQIEALLGRCALRDSKALSELYRLTSPQLLGVLLKLLRRRALAEEALQDVMVRVWQRASQFEAYRGRGMAWLVSVARNRAIDLLRSQRTHLSLEDSPAHEIADDSGHDNLEMSATDKMRSALDRCLGGLSTEQRQCITLAYVNGFSHDEISRLVGSPLGTVKSWVRRGLTSLKRCMES
ncbi:MAG TPA: sigma-70 family RNA polymerase sigma factor [Steroidobacteraceae bacterium]|nr:sigma-70 family RNA polymerase sigma factor [Steroidobacteraceae bacterium]